MTKFVLTTVGTTGDVVPYLALAEGLKGRGHQVTVVSHAVHKDRFVRRGFDFISERQPVTVGFINAVFEEAAKEQAPLRQFQVLLNQWFLRDAEYKFETLLAATQDADVVVNHALDYFGQEASIRNRRPWATVCLYPHLVPTMEAPVYPFPRLGAWWTKKTWRTLRELTDVVNRQTRLVLAPLKAPPRDLGIAGAISPHLHLLATSAAIAYRRTDWPPHVHLTGAWFEDEADFTPDPNLGAFLARHPRPVMVSFGSLGGGHAEATGALILEALTQLGRPAIVQAGFAGLLRGAAGNERIHVLDAYVPFTWLFRQSGCVVHHAGAGTATLACLAGAPSVVVPHLFDQYYYAGMLHERGAAPKPVFRSDLTAKKLAKAIEAAMTPRYAEAARSLGAQIAQEDGVKRAVELLERLVPTKARATP